MKISIDITALYIAQAGVWYYHYNLIKAILASPDLMNEFQISLLDYYPIHGGWTNPAQIQSLAHSQAQILRIKGIRHRKLSRLWFLQQSELHTAAKFVDDTLMYPWGKLAEKVMGRQLNKYLADVDIFHSSDVLQYAVPDAKNITTIYDLTTLLFPQYHTEETKDLQNKKFQFAQQQADAVIAISNSAKQDTIQLLGIAPEKVHVVYGGVDSDFCVLSEEEVSRTIAQWELRPNQYLLHVGTIEPRKNLVKLIEAYHQLRQQATFSVPKLVLAGGAGWFFREVFDRIEKLGLEDSVQYLGQVEREKLPALYNGATLFVYPSLYEGFGLPVLEAMSCGTPVMTSNVSSLPEIVGDAGILINPTDIDSITEAMFKLLQNLEKRNILRTAGLKRAKLFSWKRAAQETLAVYRKIGG